ncbi:AAA family ATPase [Sulfurospirillum barnesii]|uniref:Endonuclease GajA/Old nuclease/RecF-like AAA domain-containing protein n=1 Tax=Sulfurospirillum barnesii (strain ATCC 700032 / DSM 10660 / SES-3) TaxID=760154 RepID=I3XZS2_SULBS|nr:AAA family ATPase [Sulfurospirillum barnesii]AFL69446.1 hypothetical protein Sulba_2171 [Sulfurospirillum barnesii SES-3]
MKIAFENLGAAEIGEIELANLTIVCGENNTGKTYITYLIYNLLSNWKQFVDIDLEVELMQLLQEGTVKIDLQLKLIDKWDEICQETLKKFLNNFPEMLASNSGLFDKLKLSVTLPLDIQWKEREFKNEFRGEKGNLLVAMTKAAGSTELELAAPKSEESISRSMLPLGSFIEDRLFSMVLEDTIPNVFIASTERTGATTFRKQLNMATGNLIDLLSQVHKDGEKSITPNKIFETIYGKQEYALPVRHNVRFINQLPDSNAEFGELHKADQTLLQKFEGIVGGTYVTNKEGITYFQPKGTYLKLGLGEVSSSVRSLLILWYWLKYFAKKGDMLILDEPELNLHPSNQRRLARFLVTLVNHGLKVFITTHSDYIVKEFNTLIMLNQDLPSFESIRQKYPEYTIDDKLSASKVALYMTREELLMRAGGKRKTRTKTLKKANISPTLGIEAESFDETIDEMNAMQEAIYYNMEA